jgi:hypothetical protein
VTKLFTFVLLLAPCIAQAQTTVAGSTPGSFRVTESGAAEYRIPIRVPPGIAGMEPRLALVYNSQAGNGLLGVGWDLEGLSAIGRCPRTLAQDGVRGSVNYDANDRFCLDGQRLMAISGTYGADGTEYRTERESFNKVISYGVAGNGPAWFKAWTKSGQIIEYGNTADSRVEAQGKATVRVWAQNKISDTKGNYLTVTYIEDSPNGDYRPDRIDYTGNAGTALAPASSVRFVYESRSDVTPFYQAGALIRQTHRTVAIEAWIGSSQSGRYALAYDNLGAAGMSRVTGVAHCDALGACMPAHQLAWATVASFNNFSIKPNLVGEDGYYMGYTPYIGDFNGDGKADVLWDFKFSGSDMRSGGYRYLWLGNGDGTFSVISNLAGADGSFMGYTPYIGDFNGDGKADVLWDYKFSGSDMRSGGYRYLWLGKGDGTFTINSNVASADGGLMGYEPSIADFNGDGKADVLWDYKFSGSDMRSGGYRYLWLGKGDATFTINSNAAGVDVAYMGYEPSIADFDGDGKSDVLWNYLFSGADLRSGGYRNLWMQAGGLTDVITSFQNGLGAGTSIAYKSLTDPAVYTKDSGAVYPDMDLQMPMQVVYGAETSDGSGGTTAISKKYGGGRARLDGRGFLGFRWIEALQVETGLKVRSEFRQDWPYVGLPSVVKKTQTSGSVLSEATNTFSCINPATGSACAVAAGNRYFPFTSQSVESGNDLNGAALPTVTTTTAYDNFGNATSVVVSTGDGYSKTTTNTFANDVANWFLGRLTRSTVQSVTP